MSSRKLLSGFGLLLMTAMTSWCYAQQDAQYSQYMYNTISINPAYAGSKEMLSVSGLHRNQWLGVDGAPQTQTLSLNFPVGYVKEIGLGFSVVNDAIGPSNETYINMDFSYPIRVSRDGVVRFGLKVVGQFLDVDFNELNPEDANDPSFLNNADYEFSPNIGAGVYYYTYNFYLGLSVPNILEGNFLNDRDNTLFIDSERAHFYVITGYVFDVNPDLKFKPAILTKAVAGSPLQVDLSANFMFHEKFIFGAAYRWSAAVSALAAFRVSDTLMLGMAYDMETTELGDRAFNGGSYEVLLRFELPKKSLRRLTPRFF